MKLLFYTIMILLLIPLKNDKVVESINYKSIYKYESYNSKQKFDNSSIDGLIYEFKMNAEIGYLDRVEIPKLLQATRKYTQEGESEMILDFNSKKFVYGIESDKCYKIIDVSLEQNEHNSLVYQNKDKTIVITLDKDLPNYIQPLLFGTDIFDHGVREVINKNIGLKFTLISYEKINSSQMDKYDLDSFVNDCNMTSSPFLTLK